MVQHLCDRVAVMYLGRIVEVAPAEALDGQARHPYTRALLDSVPRLDLSSESDTIALPVPIQGELPSPLNPPSGCHFHQRCPWAERRCGEQSPSPQDIGMHHRVSCHRWREIEGLRPLTPRTER